MCLLRRNVNRTIWSQEGELACRKVDWTKQYLSGLCVSQSQCPCCDVCSTCGSRLRTGWQCPSQSIRFSFCPHTQRASVIYHQFSISKHTHMRRGTSTRRTSNLKSLSRPNQNLRNPMWWRKSEWPEWHVFVWSFLCVNNISLFEFLPKPCSPQPPYNLHLWYIYISVTN